MEKIAQIGEKVFVFSSSPNVGLYEQIMEDKVDKIWTHISGWKLKGTYHYGDIRFHGAIILKTDLKET